METEAQELNPKGEKKITKEKETEMKTIGYFSLFRYATAFEKFMLSCGIILSIVHGGMMPVFSLIFGDITSDFTPDKPAEDRRKLAAKSAFYMFLVGLGTFVSASLAMFCWSYIGKCLNIRVRKMYFKALVGQEIGWFDVENAEKMTTSYIENMAKFQGAVGKVGHVFLYSLSMTITGFAIGFYKGWWYALIVTMSFPIIMIGMMGFLYVMQIDSKVTKANYEQAGSCSEQCFGAIKTVKILNGQEHEYSIYTKFIEAARTASSKFGMIAGFSYGVFFMCVFISYGLNYWLGSVLVDREVYNGNADRSYNVSDIIAIFFSVITGAFAIGNTSPASKAIAMGKEAGYNIYQVIERQSKIPLREPNSFVPSDIRGDIDFKNVTFRYPSRPDTRVLENLSLTIPSGKKVALVGETGCGKSTTIQLIERYYDTLSGTVSIDGRDIREYNLMSLRKYIGYVGQEPVLFAMSIKENLLLAKPDATDAELYEALKQANAYGFVMKLEKKMDTYVGAGGSQLSGGQKQRISIARSILQNPKILLLDEATSALDRRNEREIQVTLDRFASNRTTVTVAHRLSTVINSDIIYVFSKGQVAEHGTHSELLAKNGAYAKLVQNQLAGMATVDPEEVEMVRRKSSEQFGLDRRESQQSPEIGVDGKVEEEEVKASDELTPEQKKELRKANKKKEQEASKRLKIYLKGNYCLLTTGCLAALACGCLMPIFAIFLADMIDVLSKFQVYKAFGVSKDSQEWKDLRTDSLMIGLYFLIMAVISLFANFFQIGIFNRLAQNITSRIRQDLYKHFLSRDMAFFDDPKNNPGELCSVLSKDCLIVNTIVSTSYGAIINGLGSFACGIVIAMIASWRLALVSLSVSPVIILTGILESSMHVTPSNDEKADSRESKTFQEVCTNMRTVGSLNANELLVEKFNEAVDKEEGKTTCSIIVVSIIYGIGQFGMFAVYALTFYAGSEFTIKYGLSFKDLFRALFAIIFAAFGAGMSQQFAGNIGAAQTAAKKIFDYLDIKNKMVMPENGVTTPIKGNIEFRNVAFTYPQRKLACFKDISFKVEPMQKVAFAGPSGGGKSTIFSLLYRFYDPDAGEIFVDGVNIKEYDITHLRNSLGMVSQEPVLFNSTIKYNIKYNRPEITDDQVVEAATVANAIKFINNDQAEGEQKIATEEGDGTGFDRKVGLKGSKLSGGQKQRVAIARTVVRKPIVYMFDESTSALDTESEKIVQDALNTISRENTTMSIAHRISTIKDSDVIFVIENGHVVEQGRFNELMQKKGHFYNLNKDK